MTRQLLLLTAVTSSALLAGEGKPLSVCEAIANRIELNGKVVEVRGKVSGGGHGIFLLPLAPCARQLVTRGIGWPDVMNLMFPINGSPDPNAHAPFEADLRSFRAADAEALKRGYRYDIDTQIATYVGLFVTYTDLEQRVNPGQRGMPRLGFGPAGLDAPVQLLMRTVKDVSVIRGTQ